MNLLTLCATGISDPVWNTDTIVYAILIAGIVIGGIWYSLAQKAKNAKYIKDNQPRMDKEKRI